MDRTKRNPGSRLSLRIYLCLTRTLSGSGRWQTDRCNVFDGICRLDHIKGMVWEVGFDPAFDPEFDALPTAVQDELLAQAKLLEVFG